MYECRFLQKKIKRKIVEIDGEDRKKNIYKQLDNFCKKNNLIYKFRTPW